MANPKVSTITACYRMSRYLRGFLESIPRQSYFENIEIVLDHNEPTTEELEWVHEFQEKYPGRLKHIKIEKVDSIGVSWNRCIQEASGEFMTIWSVDDLRTPTSIESQVKLLTDNRDVDLVYGNYEVVKSFGSTKGSIIRHRAFPESEFTRSMIFGPFFMFRKSLCERFGYFDEQLMSGLDFDFAVRLAFQAKAAMVDDNLGYYLNEGMGASTRPNSLQAVERTVIELRYGIYDKIDYSYLPEALKYNITHMLRNGEYLPIKQFVADYAEMLEGRKRLWLRKGIRSYLRRTTSVSRLINKITARIASLFR